MRQKSPRLIEPTSQKLALNAVRDWSKWLIGLDVISTIGCVMVERTGEITGLPRLFLSLAICAFSVSAVLAAMLIGGLGIITQYLPVKNEKTNQLLSIFDYPLWQDITLGNLAQWQFAVFVLGALFFLIWAI